MSNYTNFTTAMFEAVQEVIRRVKTWAPLAKRRPTVIKRLKGSKKTLIVHQCKEGDPNDVYTVAVKTDATKTVQIKRNNDLSSFQLHFIIDFVLTERKLAHGPVKFPARSISHFAVNIIMAKTGSTAKVNSAK